MLPTGNADEQVNGIDNSWSQEEVAKERILHKTSRSMEEGQDVEDDVEVVGIPECLEGVAPGILNSKHKNYDRDEGHHKSSKACHCQEKPVGESRKIVSAVVHLTEDAGQIISCLSGNVVEV